MKSKIEALEKRVAALEARFKPKRWKDEETGKTETWVATVNYVLKSEFERG